MSKQEEADFNELIQWINSLGRVELPHPTEDEVAEMFAAYQVEEAA